jgi:hypothetical protein
VEKTVDLDRVYGIGYSPNPEQHFEAAYSIAADVIESKGNAREQTHLSNSEILVNPRRACQDYFCYGKPRVIKVKSTQWLA